MAENIVRTIYGAALQAAQLVGVPFTVVEKTTLNEKFNIQPALHPTASEMPLMRYITIGNGGHRMVMGGTNLSAPEPNQHRATDAALFNHLPFVLRTTGNDLPQAVRARYALRRLETHDGVTYIAYYLKRLSVAGVVPKMEYNTVVNDTTTTTTFVPTTANLFPEPPDLSNSGSNVVTGDYVTATEKLEFLLDADEITELLNVSRIIYGNENLAIISEIGLCSGLDRMVQVSSVNDGTFNFNEAIAVQVVAHVSTFHSMAFTREELKMTFDVGATEALFKLVGAP